MRVLSAAGVWTLRWPTVGRCMRLPGRGGLPCAGSSAGVLHLMEVPRHLRRQAHNELQAMRDYMQWHVQVAEYMAKSMVGPYCTPFLQHSHESNSCRMYAVRRAALMEQDLIPELQQVLY